MNRKQLRAQCRPHLWFQLYWVVYLIWFFWLDFTVTDPKSLCRLCSPCGEHTPLAVRSQGRPMLAHRPQGQPVCALAGP